MAPVVRNSSKELGVREMDWRIRALCNWWSLPMLPTRNKSLQIPNKLMSPSPLWPMLLIIWTWGKVQKNSFV